MTSDSEDLAIPARASVIQVPQRTTDRGIEMLERLGRGTRPMRNAQMWTAWRIKAAVPDSLLIEYAQVLSSRAAPWG